MKNPFFGITAFVVATCSACGGGPAGTTSDASETRCRPTHSARPGLQNANAGSSIKLKDVASCPAGTASYKWTLLSKPGGSRANLVKADIRSPAFDPDLAGLYLFRMEETGASTGQQTLAVTAYPAGQALSIEEHTLASASSLPKFEFAIKPNLNNQGLAYANGYFYVGYDVTNGNGMIERYNASGILDSNFGRVPVTTRHTAELAYRTADDRLYAVSGGGSDPTYVYRLTQDGKAVDKVFNYSAYGNSGLIAIDNTNDLLLLATAINDKSDPTFRLIDLKDGVSVLLQFSLANQGIPQGIEIADGVIYLYTNNRITTVDLTGNIIGKMDLMITGESQGITIVTQENKRFLAVGYNQTGRIYSISAK